MTERHVKEIEVVRNTTGEVVHSVDCHAKPEYLAEKVEMGMLINMNRDEYHTRMVYLEES